MTPLVFLTLFFLASALTFSGAQSSCVGRCGGEYYRGYRCQCDYDCLTHNECCGDYESQCTTSGSCTGRCGESFRRGRECDCDSECSRYNKCCPDYGRRCGDEDVKNQTWPDLLVPTPETGSEVTEAGFYSESTSGSELSPTEPVPADPLDQTLDTTTPAAELVDLFFPTTSDPKEASGQEGTPSAVTNPNTVPEEPVNEAQTQETMLDSSTSPSASKPTPSGSSSEPTPTSPATTQPSDPISPSSETQSWTPGEDHPTLLPEGQEELDPEGQEAVSDKTLPEDSKPTASDQDNLGTVQAIDAASPTASTTASTGPTQVTPTVPEDLEVTTASQDSTALSTSEPDQTPSATAADPSSEQDTHKGDTPTTTRLGPSHPDTGDLTTGPTSDYKATPINSTKQEVGGVTTTPENGTTELLTGKPTEKPNPTKPSTVPDINQARGTDNPKDIQSDEHNNDNICSGHPVGAVTTLKNGTVVTFRGHYFWMLDSNRVPGPAHKITDVWGVPSPVDTVFTRCNCQGKTFIFKGGQYWRFENDVMDSGYPKLIREGFDGLQGQITAALSVPVYRRRRETVYFFKRGGLAQKYSYQSGTSPSCGRKVQYPVYTVGKRVARQTVSVLGPEINIRLTWRSFPSIVTSAVSIPTQQKPEGYNYYIFSRSKYYNVDMVGGQPVLAPPPASTAPEKNSAKDFLNCPK
ncbi:hypothetical protein DPEC_G00340160 [Dallia pectoralis]|uniref:Uncharacterized protein n=1 Tax=Dallia pectoralis TaxID=75939 RepID=A0ACC2F554_DALPE|nr:hypothetical protein DPEC_G00340160 [Dallia pectoralis]